MSNSKCSIHLPKITKEIFKDYTGTGLIEYTGNGYVWTQTAVDFACLLKAACNIKRGEK